MLKSHCSTIDSSSRSYRASRAERLPDAGFQQLFFGRVFSRMPMPQYVIRKQNFEFRRESHILMATLFDQWLVRQPIHDPLIHADVECDVCETNVDYIRTMVAVRRRAKNVVMKNRFIFQ
jgi:hypothetical protein